MLSTTPVSRIPSLHFLNSLTWKHSFDRPNPSPTTELKLRSNGIEVNPKLAYYIINPGQDLPGVQLRLQPILEKIWGKQCGLSGAVPVEQEIKQSLMERDIFLYIIINFILIVIFICFFFNNVFCLQILWSWVRLKIFSNG
jgi:hypothetical protein